MGCKPDGFAVRQVSPLGQARGFVRSTFLFLNVTGDGHQEHAVTGFDLAEFVVRRRKVQAATGRYDHHAFR